MPNSTPSGSPGVALGNLLTPSLSIEVEGAYGQSDVDRLSVNGRNQGSADGDLGLAQVMVNVIYEFGPQQAISPYLGVGLGAGLLDGDLRYAGQRIDDSDAAFMIQFIGGVSVDLNPNTRFFTEYRYGLVDEFELSRGGSAVRFDDLDSHQLLFGVEIAF